MLMTQEEWDKLLIESFYLRPDVSLYRLIGVDYEQIGIHGLKRFPKDRYQYYTTVYRFICERLPKLADVLWKRSKKDIDIIAKVISRSNMDVTEIKGSIRRAFVSESNMRSYGQRRYVASIAAFTIYKDNFSKANGHNWNTVK